MAEHCADCPFIKALEDKIDALWHEVSDSKKERKELREKVSKLETHREVTDEKFDRVFTAVTNIEKSINEIAAAFKELQLKKGKTLDALTYDVVKYILLIIIGVAIGQKAL